MTTIGGKTKEVKSTKPQVVVQAAEGINQYMKLVAQEDHSIDVTWIGDPNAATKFDSKYQAKSRVRDMVDVPVERVMRVLV